MKRSLKWTSAVGAALAGVSAVALWIGGANFWNPVGWVAGAVGLVSLGLSFLFSDREKKVQRQKAKATAQLRGQVGFMERQVANHVKSWFYKNITANLVRGVRADTRALYHGMFSIADDLRESVLRLRKREESVNRRLLVRTGEMMSLGKIPPDAIGRIVRDPGLKTKFLWTSKSPPSHFCKDAGEILGEWTHGIASGSSAERVAQSLVPARIYPDMVIVKNRGLAIVDMPRQEVGRAIGKGGHNISLARKLLKMQIEIREASES